MKSGKNVVLSSEGFLCRSLQSFYPHGAERLLDLRRAFENRANITFVIYLRPQYSWARSAYFQHVIEGGRLNPDSFAKQLLEAANFNYPNFVENLRLATESQTLLVRQHPRDIVLDFLSVLKGLPLETESRHSETPVDYGLLTVLQEAGIFRARALRSFGLKILAATDSGKGLPAAPFSPTISALLEGVTRRDWPDLILDEGVSVGCTEPEQDLAEVRSRVRLGSSLRDEAREALNRIVNLLLTEEASFLRRRFPLDSVRSCIRKAIVDPLVSAILRRLVR